MLGYVELFLADSAHCVWEDEGSKLYLGPARAAGAKVYEKSHPSRRGSHSHCTPHIPCHIAAVSTMIAIALFGTVKFQSAITLGLIFSPIYQRQTSFLDTRI
jgi:hypothetical protein